MAFELILVDAESQDFSVQRLAGNSQLGNCAPLGPRFCSRETLAVVSLFMDQLRTTSAARQRHPESDPDSSSVAQLLPSRLRNRLRRECDEFFARTRCDELANGARLPVGFAAPIY